MGIEGIKSKRYAKVQRKCITGTKTRLRLRNRKIAKCAITKKALRGIPRMTNSKFSKLAKSKKTIARKFGGFMSHIALKEKILKEVVLKEN